MTEPGSELTKLGMNMWSCNYHASPFSQEQELMVKTSQRQWGTRLSLVLAAVSQRLKFLIYKIRWTEIISKKHSGRKDEQPVFSLSLLFSSHGYISRHTHPPIASGLRLACWTILPECLMYVISGSQIMRSYHLVLPPTETWILLMEYIWATPI